MNTLHHAHWPPGVPRHLTLPQTNLFYKYRHPGIHEVCVIGVRDPRRGETVKALVVPAASLPRQALTRVDVTSCVRRTEFCGNLARRCQVAP
jgi:acyl-CoA synthetase (AMP-forming)/AMP-acid ligase II